VHEFETFWRRFYPDVQPYIEHLRLRLTRQWVIFHSLPQSKQYPENWQERQILLTRLNRLADEVLGEQQSCWMVQTCWVGFEHWVKRTGRRNMMNEVKEFDLVHCLDFIKREEEGGDDDDPVTIRVMAGRVVWQSGMFDHVLLRLANEQALLTFWVSEKDGAIFAPYDGGVSLFVPTALQLEALTTRYADWLPAPGYFRPQWWLK
jgi:hypothetical protein